MGRVAAGGFPPGAPKDPDVQIFRIRFLKSWRGACGEPSVSPWHTEDRNAPGAGQTNSREDGSSAAAGEATCPRRFSLNRASGAAFVDPTSLVEVVKQAGPLKRASCAALADPTRLVRVGEEGWTAKPRVRRRARRPHPAGHPMGRGW
jgi:hypothetical protein